MSEKTLHIAMYPWFAMGHLTSFLKISNKLAERGHRISFFLPTKTQPKLEPLNLHPHLITFIPVTVPHVDGLPPGTETTADVPSSFFPLLLMAMDLKQPAIEASLRDLKPQFVFFDFAYWLPSLSGRLGIKTILYSVSTPASIGYFISPERKQTESALMEPPPGFPPSSIKLHVHEARALAATSIKEYFGGTSLMDRLFIARSECDAVCFKTCREIEGPYIDYIENQFKRPVILAGPEVSEPPTSALEERWARWLGKFEAGSVIFCAFGSECILKKDQFQELILGFELTGLPFLAALKPPAEAETVESAFPEGFEERVGERAIVHGGWVQQQLILGHPSVGCFVTHCGSGSLSEGLVKECQLVMVPNIGDQLVIARMMSNDLKIGVEIERGEEDGLFTRDGVCKAVRSVMDDDSEVGKEVRTNHAKWREVLLGKGLESSYVDGFVQELLRLLG